MGVHLSKLNLVDLHFSVPVRSRPAVRTGTSNVVLLYAVRTYAYQLVRVTPRTSAVEVPRCGPLWCEAPVVIAIQIACHEFVLPVERVGIAVWEKGSLGMIFT